MAIADEHRLGRTPLTDPRSLGTSALFHVLLAALASLSVLSAVMSPADDEGRKALRGVLEPVDNRAKGGEESGAGGGGGPGEIGGLGDPDMAARPSDSPEIKPVRDPTADALLSEILPRSVVNPEESPMRDLPDLPTSGAGLIPGSGSGGAGVGAAGPAGASAGGSGRGPSSSAVANRDDRSLM
ncbi:hypothetical protein [Planctomyces sp. SH-PL62]|uniref:hypothetical protein n=1 Tax=Planctomyces sp. SH-PL62 TaxID=1636152 RepID=UPI00078DAF0F|nr:hypothetical protein [Planctomyces sp. SH-PL62]AMV40353.1 hypothetical protein VT85_23175 [Planctomyces sp. SH-PL62]